MRASVGANALDSNQFVNICIGLSKSIVNAKCFGRSLLLLGLLVARARGERHSEGRNCGAKSQSKECFFHCCGVFF